MKLCECGCGKATPIAKRTDTKCGAVKGQPRRFALGHSGVGSHRTREQKRAYFRNWKRRVSAETIVRYGGKCACCGEDRREFLSIYHIEGGGSKHRKELGMNGGCNFYTWLRSQGYPDGYRVLCHNCNQALGNYGYCPHSNEVVRVA
jgi:hypothetical protein